MLFAPLLAKDAANWKSEKDFRNAAPMVHRQALWLEANPDAETWGDSLKTVLNWGRNVAYATLATAKVFEKEVQNLPKDPAAGRISSMLMVGYVQFAAEAGFAKATEFELAKAGLTCMIRYYEAVKQAKPDYSIPAMERLRACSIPMPWTNTSRPSCASRELEGPGQGIVPIRVQGGGRERESPSAIGIGTAAQIARERQTIHPYTDLLLHDMGPGLADNLHEGDATGAEWRTPPLWNIGYTARVSSGEAYLHDGRARTLEEAIKWHGGEGAKAANAFNAMSAAESAALISFLKSL